MKWTRIAVLLALTSPAWAASANLTTNASAPCPANTNTSALVVGLAEDKGGATLTVSGTWTGTISFYGTGSGGSLWTALSATPLGSSTAVTSTTANGTWQVNAAGFTGICMLSSASMTGTATVTITPSAASARSNGSGSGGGVSISATSPIVVSPNPITGTGTVSCPTCALNTIPACSTISGGVPASGQCYVPTSVLTAAAVNASNNTTAPIDVIPAQGTNRVIDIIDGMCEKTAGTAYAFGGGTNLAIGYDNGNSTTSDISSNGVVGFLDQTAIINQPLPGTGAVVLVAGLLQDLGNLPIAIYIENGTTTGGSPLYCTFSYRIHTNQ